MGRNLNMENWEEKICKLNDRINRRNKKIDNLGYTIDDENEISRLKWYNDIDETKISSYYKEIDGDY